MSPETVLEEIRKRVDRAYAHGYKDGSRERMHEFLADLYKYKEQIGFQKHITLDLLIEKWEAKLTSSPGGKF